MNEDLMCLFLTVENKISVCVVLLEVSPLVKDAFSV